MYIIQQLLCGVTVSQGNFADQYVLKLHLYLKLKFNQSVYSFLMFLPAFSRLLDSGLQVLQNHLKTQTKLNTLTLYN